MLSCNVNFVSSSFRIRHVMTCSLAVLYVIM
nr:MAG TPA: hypothetical protein [Caudoviricetes sp.]